MKREAKLLLGKACDSLILSIELFNRPHDRGRSDGVLIFLDHSLEMLMKAAILHRNGKIREAGNKETIGFDACVGRSLSNGHVRYLTEDQALVLQAINDQRNPAQHHLLNISEGQLYLHVQSGVTVFRDILRTVFGQELTGHLPRRVLPVSTEPPVDLVTLFDSEIEEVRKLLQPGRRRHTEALARLRPLAILNATLEGKKGVPTDTELRRIGKAMADGQGWESIFAGVAVITVVSDGNGPSLTVRLAKKEGVPVQLVQDGAPGASVVAVKRVDELGYYTLGARTMAPRVGLTEPKLLAVIDYLGIQQDPDYFKEIKVGKSLHKRYSQKALPLLRKTIQEESVEDIWQSHRPGKKPKRQAR
ncbi:MAG: hypothetical protein OXS47_11940 [Chloroflexota bacterium]|nr:hypothetical protein [Chloroflexota bacterium]